MDSSVRNFASNYLPSAVVIMVAFWLGGAIGFYSGRTAGESKVWAEAMQANAAQYDPRSGERRFKAPVAEIPFKGARSHFDNVAVPPGAYLERRIGSAVSAPTK